MENQEQPQASEIDIRDPSYRRVAGTIWLVAGAATLALSVCYSNLWWLTTAVMLIGGGCLMLTKHYGLVRLPGYLMIGVLYAWVWINRGWQTSLICLGSGLLVGLLFTALLRKRAR
jgi:hypothetical protein